VQALSVAANLAAGLLAQPPAAKGEPQHSIAAELPVVVGALLPLLSTVAAARQGSSSAHKFFHPLFGWVSGEAAAQHREDQAASHEQAEVAQLQLGQIRSLWREETLQQVNILAVYGLLLFPACLSMPVPAVPACCRLPVCCAFLKQIPAVDAPAALRAPTERCERGYKRGCGAEDGAFGAAAAAAHRGAARRACSPLSPYNDPPLCVDS